MVQWTVDLLNNRLYSENFEAILNPGSYTIVTDRWRTDTPGRQEKADILTETEVEELAKSATAALREFLRKHPTSSCR